MSKNTLNTISEQTGVSVSTVSRVLSGQAEKYRISPVTAGKIREAAEQCGYIPDLVAKGLRTRRTGTVGLTIPNIDNPFFSSLSCILVSELKRLGLHVLLADRPFFLLKDKNSVHSHTDGVIHCNIYTIIFTAIR